MSRNNNVDLYTHSSIANHTIDDMTLRTLHTLSRIEADYVRICNSIFDAHSFPLIHNPRIDVFIQKDVVVACVHLLKIAQAIPSGLCERTSIKLQFH